MDPPSPITVSPSDVFSITYNLDVKTNTFGYDISEIQTIQGFGNGQDSNQQNQNYEVFVSTVGSAGFTSLESVAYNPFTGAATNGSTQVNITENATGILATGVDAIRFTYTIPTVAPANQGTQPSPTIREIDVFGTVAVPEPSSSALLGLAGIGLILRRRN